MRYLACLIALLLLEPALAQERAGSSERPATAEVITAPVIPTDATWAPIMLMIIGGLFIAAATMPMVYLNRLEEVPPMHAHDEPPGTSHHHGESGTLNPDPEGHPTHGHP